MVLIHELAHIRRFDYLVRLIQNALKVIFFFHPLFHLMNRNLMRAREHVCDDWVIATTDRRGEYARCIIGLLEKAIHKPVNIPVIIAMAERKRDVPKRIEMITDRNRKVYTKVSRKALAAILTIGCLSLFIVGSIELVRFAMAKPASSEGRIVFSKGLGFNYEIFTMNSDGSDVKKLSDNPATDWFPSVSPDGTKIAFSRQPTQGAPIMDIWLMDANGKNEKKLTEWGWDTSWSPDGTHIAFDRSIWEQKDGKWEMKSNWAIYVMNSDGNDSRKLIESQTQIFTDPSWSPDGRRIAFVEQPSQGGRAPQIWVMDMDGGNQKMLNDWGDSPAWSPDGKRIVFSSYRDGWAAWKTKDIYVMDADGTDVKILTNPGPSSKNFPTWSPDGTKIAFCLSEGDNPTDLYIMNVDGENVNKITDTPEWEWSLDWTAFSYAVESGGKLKSTWGKIKGLSGF